MHFNPRSLAGATPAPTPLSVIDGAISIHAPSRERPAALTRQANVEIISIHAPSRERLLFHYPEDFVLVISIHAPSRERPDTIQIKPSIKQISIHAPSRERLILDCLPVFPISFQSTLPRGSDQDIPDVANEHPVFQSTLPRGSDIDSQRASQEYLIFQSTLPRGSDLATVAAWRSAELISIHAPSRERL